MISLGVLCILFGAYGKIEDLFRIGVMNTAGVCERGEPIVYKNYRITDYRQKGVGTVMPRY
jgi:hypothetical protein